MKIYKLVDGEGLFPHLRRYFVSLLPEFFEEVNTDGEYILYARDIFELRPENTEIEVSRAGALGFLRRNGFDGVIMHDLAEEEIPIETEK